MVVMTEEAQRPVTKELSSNTPGWLVWCEPIERKVCKLVDGDMDRAIAWYEEHIGEIPALIALNPKNALFSRVPEGVELRLIGGVAGYEIWLATGEPQPVSRGIFNIKRDNEIIKAGGFFCHACLVGKVKEEQSPDPRYCRGCCEFLVGEARELPKSQRPSWMPKSGGKVIPVSQDVVLNMHTLSNKKTEVCIIRPTVPAGIHGSKRGPKHRALPEDLIRQWAGEGMGSKAIVTRLKSERNINVHYSTIQRLLSGQRKQLSLPI